MNKKRKRADEMRREYEPQIIRGGVRGKYAERFKAGTNLVLIAPDLAQAFPDQEAVNNALRLLLKIAKRSAG